MLDLVYIIINIFLLFLFKNVHSSPVQEGTKFTSITIPPLQLQCSLIPIKLASYMSLFLVSSEFCEKLFRKFFHGLHLGILLISRDLNYNLSILGLFEGWVLCYFKVKTLGLAFGCINIHSSTELD